MHRSLCFTLNELLVVLVIVGVIIGLASIAFSDKRSDELKREAQRLSAVLTLAAEEAIVASRELGVRFDADGYGFFVLGDDQTWLPLEHDREFAAHRLPQPLHLTLLTDARAVSARSADDQQRDEPHAYFFATGELYPPFELTLSHPDLPTRYRIEARMDGKVELHAEE